MTSRIASAESVTDGRAVDSEAGTRLRGIRAWILRRSRRPRVLAVLAIYLLAAAAPCPAPALRGAEATARSAVRTRAPDAAHAAHPGHGPAAHAAGPTAPSGADGATEADCERPLPLWTGHCRCGCGERQTPLASSLGFVLLLAKRTAPPRLDSVLAPHLGAPRLPVPPAGAIDHVPLPA